MPSQAGRGPLHCRIWNSVLNAGCLACCKRPPDALADEVVRYHPVRDDAGEQREQEHGAEVRKLQDFDERPGGDCRWSDS